MSKGVARVNKDRADSPLASGAKTVLTNNEETAFEGSETVSGNTVIQGSTSVFVENKPIARMSDLTAKGTPIMTGSTDVITGNLAPSLLGVPFSPSITISAPYQSQASSRVRAYEDNPTRFYNPEARSAGIKQNYVEPPDIGVDETTPSQYLTVPVADDIIPFLTKILEEAKRGLWKETGGRGKASNQNIIGIWRSLGFNTDQYPWNTDQTAWCAGFMNFVLKCCGYNYLSDAASVTITRLPQKFNAVQVPKDQAQPGDICYWNTGGQGHNNFVYTADNGKFTFVGGNQGYGDVTISFPGGASPLEKTWKSCWRPSKKKL